MLNAIKNYNISILALQEMRWPGEGSLKKDDKTIFYSGNRDGKFENGVGFVISENILPHVKDFQAINERMCYIRITGRIFDLIIINCYAPTEDIRDDIKEDFYEDLDRICDITSNYSIKIVLGDFNAKIGKEEVYRPTIGRDSLHDTSNDNGTRLINFCMTNGMVLSSTYFPRKDIHKQTWVAPNQVVKNQIDHIMIQNRHKGCIQNIRTYRGADADSDHYLVMAKFMTRLSVHWRENKGKLSEKFCTEKFAEEHISNEFAHTTHHEMLRLNNENNENNNENVEHIWKKIKTTVINSAKSCLGIRKNSKKKNWFNEKCKETVDRRNKLREIALRNPTDENLERYKASKIETNKTLRKEKRQKEKRKIEEMEKNSFNSKKFFSNSKDIKQGYKQQIRMIRNQTGELLTYEKDIAEEFKNYYKMLLNKTASTPPNATDIQYSTAEPCISNPSRLEINWSINKLKNNKAPGESNVLAELFKNSGESLKNEIWKIINLIWEKEVLPEEWNLSILCPVFKKGDVLDTKNYRGISLLDTCYKEGTNVDLEKGGQLQIKYHANIMSSKKPSGSWFAKQRLKKEKEGKKLAKDINKWLISETINANNVVVAPPELEPSGISSNHLNISVVESEQIDNVDYFIENNQIDIDCNINFKDPGTWPPITSSIRTLLVEKGPQHYEPKNVPSDDKGRHFIKKWFYRNLSNGERVRRQWLMYSELKNSVFCFPCLLFSNDNRTCSFLNNGFDDWQHLNPYIPDHEKSKSHLNNFISWKELEKRIHMGVTIDCEFEKSIEKEKEKWRNILRIIIDVILFCSKNNLALRGTTEKIGDLNSGIFLQLIELISHYSPILAQHVQEVRQSNFCTSYFSPTIQNEIIVLLGQTIRNKIITSIKEAKYYGIMFDCTPDISHKEQMSQIIRYVKIDNTEISIEESFVDFIQSREKTGTGLTSEILKKLEEDGIKLKYCRAQGYDNGANMAGKYNGVQAVICRKNELATFIPCAAHSLNRIGVHAAETSPTMISFFGTV
ncbi:hypothetical protein QTP88_028976 [Uroleucon formosanum]